VEKTLRKFIYLIAGLLIVIVLGGIVGTLVLVDDHPVVQQVDKPTTQSLKLAKQTLKQINHALKTSGGHKQITLKQHQLTAIFALVSDIFNNISARQNSAGNSLMISASIRLPDNPFGGYININSMILDDYADTELGRTAIGKLSISNQQAIALLTSIVKWRAGDEFKQPSGDWVEDISVKQGDLFVRFNPALNTEGLLVNLKSKGRETLDVFVPTERFASVQVYYDYLVSSTRLVRDSKISVSQFEYIKLVLEKARQRSDFSNAQDENISALLALGLFVGDSDLQRAINGITRVDHLVGYRNKVVLANRHDLNLHFIYSAILTILSNQGITVSIGEIKEVSDSGAGGSGFSFVDLAADRAGVKFAEFATGSLETARILQQNIQQIQTESGVFPGIDVLQEGLTEAQFKQAYQDRASAEYKAVIAEIDRRIAGLEVYRR
jgi:hypothetical protein